MTVAVKNPILLHVEIDLDGAVRKVGDLAGRDRRAFFQYDAAFLETGIEFSPFKLPLGPRLFEADPGVFEGLHGLFNDSLPDGWGRPLLDRSLRRLGVLPGALTPLARLAHVGAHGMGALRYRPEIVSGEDVGDIDLDVLAEGAREVLEGDPGEVLGQLLALNGSSGGARPKVVVGVSADGSRLIHHAADHPPGYEPWLIKFPSSADAPDIGAIELAYARMAVASGIEMAEVRLFPSRTGAGYFGTRRFDRDGKRRIHVHTLAGLIDADTTRTAVSYETLLKVTRALTRDQREVEKVFDCMVFNVAAHNRDDHAKNHAFLLAGREWKATPAYDLTFSSGPGGEHTLDVMGNGRDPCRREIVALAARVDIPPARARESLDRIGEAVSKWPSIATDCGVSSASAREIGKVLAVQLRKLVG